jgi:hypothetical protein
MMLTDFTRCEALLDHGDQILDAAFPKEVNDALDLDDHAIKLGKIWLPKLSRDARGRCDRGWSPRHYHGSSTPAGLHVIGPALPIDGLVNPTFLMYTTIIFGLPNCLSSISSNTSHL